MHSSMLTRIKWSLQYLGQRGSDGIMKKLLFIFILVVFLLYNSVSCFASEANIGVFLDGEQLTFDVPPTIVQDRTLVPMRKIFEILGMSVDWKGETQTITGEKAGKKIILQIDKRIATIDDKQVEMDVPVKLINGRTMVPLRFIAESTNADVKWDESTSTVLITTRKSMNIHLFYGMGSYNQFQKFVNDGTIDNVDSIGFAWSRMEYDASNDSVLLNVTNKNGNQDFYMPEGWNQPVEIIQSRKKLALLNIFADKNFHNILEKREAAIKAIVDGLNYSVNGKNISFDGIIIDFEVLPLDERENFSTFLRTLTDQLTDSGKKLYVTVPPNKWTKSYDYRTIGNIADKVILMAHDFEPKSLPASDSVNEVISTPLTPINDVKEALSAIVDENNGIVDKNKIILQLNMASTQWKVKDGNLSGEYVKEGNIIPFHPSYEAIFDRINKEQTDIIIHFDEKSSNPYISYTGSDGTINYIWYEDSRSVEKKISVAREFGIVGVSLWRMGNIPNYINNDKACLDIWGEVCGVGSSRKIKQLNFLHIEN